MINFLLGIVAGGVIVAIAATAAVRQPGIQATLGLFPVSTAALMPAAKLKDEPARQDLPCRPAVDVGQPEMLFSRRRFWSVAP